MGTTGGKQSTGTSITVANNYYNPSSSTISAGMTITWTWDSCVASGSSQTCTSHSVTFDDGVASSTQSSGSYARTFGSPGTYTYHCAIHGAAMSGTVTVR
jgi:plastocyanin